MLTDRMPHSMLVVSGSAKGSEYLCDLFTPAQFAPVVCVASAGEAKRALVQTSFDLILINTPLTDEFGTQLALELAETPSRGILLLVKGDAYESIADKLEDQGIVAVPKPVSKQAIYQAVRILVAVRAKISRMEQKNASLQAKMEEIRVVNRAKWILIKHLNMDEGQAHHYIEKQAMDLRSSKGDIARGIIKTYEG